jgi:hypothetical protein
MPSTRRYRSCRICGASVPFVTISARGLCADHSRMRLEANLAGLVSRSGPEFRRWREGMARGVGGELLDARRDAA